MPRATGYCHQPAHGRVSSTVTPAQGIAIRSNGSRPNRTQRTNMLTAATATKNATVENRTSVRAAGPRTNAGGILPLSMFIRWPARSACPHFCCSQSAPHQAECSLLLFT
jgi:hypothetical protein